MDTPGPASMLMYNNSASPMSLVYDSSHNITSHTDLSNNSLFLNDHRIHRETSVILRVWHYLGHSRPAHQTGNLHPCPWHHHIYGLRMSICPSCVFQTWCSFSCHLQQRLGVYVKLLSIFKHCSQYVASLHLRLPSQRWWTNWMHKLDPQAILLYIL